LNKLPISHNHEKTFPSSVRAIINFEEIDCAFNIFIFCGPSEVRVVFKRSTQAR
jgi:hypothetical protein